MVSISLIDFIKNNIFDFIVFCCIVGIWFYAMIIMMFKNGTDKK